MLFDLLCLSMSYYIHSCDFYIHCVIEAAAKKQAQLQAKKDAAESECHVYFIST